MLRSCICPDIGDETDETDETDQADEADPTEPEDNVNVSIDNGGT